MGFVGGSVKRRLAMALLGYGAAIAKVCGLGPSITGAFHTFLLPWQVRSAIIPCSEVAVEWLKS